MFWPTMTATAPEAAGGCGSARGSRLAPLAGPAVSVLHYPHSLAELLLSTHCIGPDGKGQTAWAAARRGGAAAGPAGAGRRGDEEGVGDDRGGIRKSMQG